jgi:BlaI family transcriptional regulator, penicillinase repressor
MARPKAKTPTPAELEILEVLWDRGPSTVRDVLDVLSTRRKRAYTSIMNLLNIMADKGLVTREPQGRAFLYRACKARENTIGRIVRDMLGRVFSGSASSLVAHVLDQSKPSEQELAEIRRAIQEYVDKEKSP